MPLWLRAEAAEGLRVFGYIVRQELQRRKAAEFHILGLINHTHSAPAEFLDDAVVRDGLADQVTSLRRTILGLKLRQVNISRRVGADQKDGGLLM